MVAEVSNCKGGQERRSICLQRVSADTNLYVEKEPVAIKNAAGRGFPSPRPAPKHRGKMPTFMRGEAGLSPKKQPILLQPLAPFAACLHLFNGEPSCTLSSPQPGLPLHHLPTSFCSCHLVNSSLHLLGDTHHGLSACPYHCNNAIISPLPPLSELQASGK